MTHVPVDQISTVIDRQSWEEFERRSRYKVALSGDIAYRGVWIKPRKNGIAKSVGGHREHK